MTDETAEFTDRKCKGIGHVRVTINGAGGRDVFLVGAVYVDQLACKNDPAYAGWGVRLTVWPNNHSPKPGMQLLPELAELLPQWLRRAARKLTVVTDRAVIEHTVDGVFVGYVRLDANQCRSTAAAVDDAVSKAPAGTFG